MAGQRESVMSKPFLDWPLALYCIDQGSKLTSWWLARAKKLHSLELYIYMREKAVYILLGMIGYTVWQFIELHILLTFGKHHVSYRAHKVRKQQYEHGLVQPEFG